MDTLGVILLAGRNPDKVVALLRAANERMLANPQVQFHLAQALARTGDTEEAKDLLRTILSRHGAFDERDKAERLLDDIGD